MTPNAETRRQWPLEMPGISLGCDYNPEQWPTAVQLQDLELMSEAGVSLVSLGIFAWALLEPTEGQFDLDWLEAIVNRLYDRGISVDLATGTASPPPWLSRRYPEILPQGPDGTRLWPGARQAWCPSSPVFREKSGILVQNLAARFCDHPGIVLWHVSNELGCHVAACYCDVSADAFREWLQERYRSLDALNAAWGTTFWSQRYSDWNEILPPRSAPAQRNPTHQLDFRRFSSDELLTQYRLERDVLKRLAPGIPVTTNFMVMSGFNNVDYGVWAPEMDLVSNDHYTVAGDPEKHIELAFSADRTRGLASGESWFLMEHATSASNWFQRNIAKRPGELIRHSISHVARGADAVCFFQWRASQAGAEKFHSAMVPHAGTDTKVFREVVQLGRVLQSLAEVAGSRVEADVAILVDHEAWWGATLDSHPSVDVAYLDVAYAAYRELWGRSITADVIDRHADLSRYRLLIVPTLYLVTDEFAESVRGFAEAGGTVLVTYFSGIVDVNDHIRLGGYPGAFRDLVGVSVEEFFPLAESERVRLDDGSVGSLWTELLHPLDAQTVTTYVDGPLPGVPAITRRECGEGSAWYLATYLDRPGMASLVDRLLADADVRPRILAPAGCEVVTRRADGADYVFVINHGDDAVRLPLGGTELLTRATLDDFLDVPGGAVRVVRTSSAGSGGPAPAGVRSSPTAGI
jgi:beta-galactosidase